MKQMFTAIISGFLLLVLAACSADNPAMISSANPHASRAGADMLKKGGSAMDAAIAAQLVLGLVEPQSSGIGGGAFAVYWQADKKRLTSFDGREKAPATADENLFLDLSGKPHSWRFASIGGRAVGVPGVIAMSYKAHQKFGRLKWAQLFEPAIQLAEKGFVVSPRLHNAIVRSQKALRANRQARSIYFEADGLTPVAVGNVLKNIAYAKTLRLVAQKGPQGFYSGPVADAIVAAVNGHVGNPGSLSHKDLANYRAIERRPVCGAYRAYKVCGMPPPTSGGLTSLMILGTLESYKLGAMRPGSPIAMHLFTQAARLSYADRDVYMADSDFITVPIAGLLEKAYLKNRSRLIVPLRDMGRAGPGVPTGADARFQKTAGVKMPEYGTSHLSVVDQYGNAISMTTSVERAFGAHIMAGGFVLNNQLTDFSFMPEKNGVKIANRVEGGKRPRSSMSPTLIFNKDGTLFATVGSPGGSRIIEFVSRTVIGLVDWQLPMQAAIDLGNVNNRNRLTELEAGTPVAQFAPSFNKMGHTVKVRPLTSGLHGIRIVNGMLDGGADKRREGVVITVE